MIFVKKLGDIDFGAFNNSVYFFSKIRYSLRDIGKIIFLSRLQSDPALPYLGFGFPFFISSFVLFDSFYKTTLYRIVFIAKRFLVNFYLCFLAKYVWGGIRLSFVFQNGVMAAKSSFSTQRHIQSQRPTPSGVISWQQENET